MAWPIARCFLFELNEFTSIPPDLPEATEQMQRAHAGLNDTSLVKHFAPINIEEYKKNKLAMKKGEAAGAVKQKSLR